MVDRAWEDETGIHYVKNVPEPRKSKPAQCKTCGSPATCMPRLYVPCHALSPVHIDDISTLLAGLTLCDRHFSTLKAEQVLGDEHGAVIRQAVEQAFRMRGATPNFAKAVFGRIPANTEDFIRGQDAEEAAAKGRGN